MCACVRVWFDARVHNPLCWEPSASSHWHMMRSIKRFHCQLNAVVVIIKLLLLSCLYRSSLLATTSTSSSLYPIPWYGIWRNPCHLYIDKQPAYRHSHSGSFFSRFFWLRISKKKEKVGGHTLQIKKNICQILFTISIYLMMMMIIRSKWTIDMLWGINLCVDRSVSLSKNFV